MLNAFGELPALDLTAKLIEIPSVSGSEADGISFLESEFRKRGWNPERIEAQPGRDNILVSFGAPRIIFTTHIDVVPAPKELFTPRFESGILYGRGACDAKGMIGSMVQASEELLAEGESGFGILIVVGEEVDGIGARTAAAALKNRGIEYLINGEPTENKIVLAHKGALSVTIKFKGRSCHSGYPELGQDANRAMIAALGRIAEADFGEDELLGRATVNIGVVKGGTAANVVSNDASADILIRLVGSDEDALTKLREICPEAQITAAYSGAVSRMISVPGFETDIAKYCTDVPNFSELNAKAVLFGPGSIHNAHTVNEQIREDELKAGVQGYKRIFRYLLNSRP